MKKRKVDLATTLNISTTYAGEFAGTYIAAALLEANTIAEDLIVVKPNVAKSEVVKKLTVSNIIADATCDFTPIGDVGLTERKVEPKELQVNLEICKTPFIADWEAMSVISNGMLNKQLPPKFSDFFLAEVAAQVAVAVENNIWHGVKATTGQFDGFIPQATLDPDVLDVVLAPVTASNVIAELTKMYNAIPNPIFDKQDLSLYVAPNVYRAYQLALSALGYKQEYYVGNKPADFAGLPVRLISGMKPSYMVAAQRENLWFATALLSDTQQVKLLDMSDLDGSDNVRVIMKFSADTNFGLGSEFVLGTPA